MIGEMDQDRTALADAAEAVRAVDFDAWKEQELADIPSLFVTMFSNVIDEMIEGSLKPLCCHVADVLERVSAFSGYTSPATLSAARAASDTSKLTPPLKLAAQVKNAQKQQPPEQDTTLAELQQRIRNSVAKNVNALSGNADRVAMGLVYAHATDADSLTQKRQEFERLESETEGLQVQLREALSKAEQAHKHVELMMAEAGLLQEAKSFSLAKEKFASEATKWTWCAAVAASALCLLLAVFMWRGNATPLPAHGWSAAANLAHFAPRLALVSVLSFVLAVSVRNFRAAAHNQVLNAHRSATVATVRMLAGTSDSKVHEALLLLASQSVFAPASTGYDGKEPMVPSTLPDILRELRGGRAKDET